MKRTPKQLRLEREAAAHQEADAAPAAADQMRGPGRFNLHYIDEIITKAMQRGDFDDLPGKGKPLNLEEPDPYDNSGSWLAHHLLKNANMAPEWIELDKQIRAEVDWLRQHSPTHPERRSRIVELNQKILQFNVTRPSSVPTKPRYRE